MKVCAPTATATDVGVSTLTGAAESRMAQMAHDVGVAVIERGRSTGKCRRTLSDFPLGR